jgi:hypothetical protein
VKKILFQQTNYIDENTSISTHQNINVYGKPKQKYEVLLSSRAVYVRLLVFSTADLLHPRIFSVEILNPFFPLIRCTKICCTIF